MSHAKLSPSAAYRWLACPGSVALPSPPDESSEFADEGTAAHTLASWCLTQGRHAAYYRESTIDVKNDDGSLRRSFDVNEDMADNVQVYVDAIRDRIVDDAQLFVEQKLDTGLESKRYGKITGTGDAIILKPSEGLLEVHDLKFGRGVKVFAKNNPQLMLYALGAMHDFAWLMDTRAVRVAIHQPRLDHYDEHTYTVDQLASWFLEVQETIAKLDAGATDEVPGDHCKFCPRKVQCKALEKEADKFLADFPDISDLTEHGIAAAMDKVELVELRCAAVRAEARRLLDSGVKVPGWTLEEGRQGNRKWADEKRVEQSLAPLGDIAYKPKTLISPADAEKKFAKKHPAIWTDLQQHIVRGAPTVNMVRDDGSRKPYAAASLEDFKETA